MMYTPGIAMAKAENPPMPIKISIITATYHIADLLPGCLDSITAQTYPHLEVIVVDGASTDGTVDILRDYEGKLDLRWISEPDEGLYDAWNKALPMASGDWIYFLGADDRLHHPESMARAAEALARVPAGTLVAYGVSRAIWPNGRIGLSDGRPWEKIRHKFNLSLCFGHQATFHSPELFKRVGTFDANCIYSGDWKIILQSLSHADPYFIGDIVIADWYWGGLTSLPRYRLDVMREYREFQRELGCHPSWYRLGYFLRYLRALMWYVMARLKGQETARLKGQETTPLSYHRWFKN